MPLTEAQRRHLEQRLREERARAGDALERTLANWSLADGRGRAGDLTSVPFHPADRGTDTIDDELEAASATRLSRELAEIDAALARLYEAPERFGRCVGTDREIPFERLEVIPWARTCTQAGM
jgi:RNA polymerase-binding transcription factor DksA